MSGAIDRLPLIVPALRACWMPPPGLLGLERLEVTARFAIRTDGSLIGGPLVTFSTGVVEPRARELLTRSVLEAIRACTPLRMSPGLSRAIAGRPVSIRFIYVGRRGQGI